jgi:hypothetical protein
LSDFRVDAPLLITAVGTVNKKLQFNTRTTSVPIQNSKSSSRKF